MALAYLLPRISSCCINFHGEDHHHKVLGLGFGNVVLPLSQIGISRVPIASRFRRRDHRVSVRCSRFGSSATKQARVVEKSVTPATSLDIPVTCYQIVGVPDQAEKDEIVKSVMELKSAEIEEGYTMDAVISRQDILMDVRDKLLFEPEYAGNMKEKIPPKSSVRIPWNWLPGALCLLQEVGEEKLVLDIGRAALQRPEAKPYIHDLLLSMALAECATAKIGFEKNNVSQGFEALARAQCLLRSKISLGKMTLLAQDSGAKVKSIIVKDLMDQMIEESLEELAPACTLELLAIPRTPENAERRRGAIAALRELLRQGLDVEASCQVQDWPCFFSQALNRLLATEIVDLLPWDNIAITRKNKKSLESQNQRGVIDFNCFYMALIAHIALGLSSKQTYLISKAKTVCDCLMASGGIDLKFEEAFCSFLLGQGDEAEVVERLRQIDLNANTPSRSSISGNEIKDVSVVKPSLEMWLKEAVLGVFPDTRDCSPSLTNFFRGEKKSPGIRQTKGAPQTMSGLSHRPMSTNLASDRRDFEESLPYSNSSRHLGSAVKQLAQANLQSSLAAEKNTSESTLSPPSIQLNRKLGAHHDKVWESWFVPGDVVGRITFMAVLGCIFFTSFKLWGMKLGKMRRTSRLASYKPNMETSSIAWSADSSLEHDVGPACIKGISIAGRLKKLLAMAKMKLGNPDAGNLSKACLAASLSSSMTTVYRRPMPIEEAEALVKQWQSIKAEALGPSHDVHSLSEVLDESMLFQWQSLADAAKDKSCFWRFVLLQLSVLQADILSDGMGAEMAEIEALLEEAAELVEESQSKNPNYYSSYKIRYILRRQDDGSWRFCEGDIQTPS